MTIRLFIVACGLDGIFTIYLLLGFMGVDMAVNEDTDRFPLWDWGKYDRKSRLNAREVPRYKMYGMWLTISEVLKQKPLERGSQSQKIHAASTPEGWWNLPRRDRNRLLDSADAVYEQKFNCAKTVFASIRAQVQQDTSVHRSHNSPPRRDVDSTEMLSVEVGADDEMCREVRGPSSPLQEVMSHHDSESVAINGACSLLSAETFAAPPIVSATNPDSDRDAAIRQGTRHVYDSTLFRALDTTAYGSHGPGNSFKLKIKFSEIFRDWVISEDIPRGKAMRLIKTLKKEHDDGLLIVDLGDMNVSWEGLTKLYSKNVRLEAPIKSKYKDGVPGQKRKIEQQSVNMKILEQIQLRRPGVIAATFSPRRLPHPRVPHFWIELWTDGVEIKKSGELKNLWPISCCFLAVGDSHESTKHHVPAYAAQPFTVYHHLAGTKPATAEILLREVVNDVLSLDPRDPSCSDNIAKWGFSITLYKFSGDSPAQAFVKCVYGHTSTFPCLKCRIQACHVHQAGGMQLIQHTPSLPREDAKFEGYYKHVDTVLVSFHSLSFNYVQWHMRMDTGTMTRVHCCRC